VTGPLDIEGPAAPPRSNGELVFAEPWEGRAFGLVVALHEAGHFTWRQFRSALIARIAAWEASAQSESWHYYHHWLGALEDVLARNGTVLTDEITARAEMLARRPAGHDHTDDQHHSH
jgi:nitrile hydratase accessory protein